MHLGGFNPRAHAGRDIRLKVSKRHKTLFQSTRPRGARLARRQRGADSRQVSIHAPTRGATWSSPFVDNPANLFQSTRPRGARLTTYFAREACTLFQSTRPRGARLAYCVKGALSALFQSTRPRGARLLCHRTRTRLSRFQSTRPRGARRKETHPCRAATEL